MAVRGKSELRSDRLSECNSHGRLPAYTRTRGICLAFITDGWKLFTYIRDQNCEWNKNEVVTCCIHRSVRFLPISSPTLAASWRMTIIMIASCSKTIPYHKEMEHRHFCEHPQSQTIFILISLNSSFTSTVLMRASMTHPQPYTHPAAGLKLTNVNSELESDTRTTRSKYGPQGQRHRLDRPQKAPPARRAQARSMTGVDHAGACEKMVASSSHSQSW